jgi:hypothetical protein
MYFMTQKTRCKYSVTRRQHYVFPYSTSTLHGGFRFFIHNYLACNKDPPRPLSRRLADTLASGATDVVHRQFASINVVAEKNLVRNETDAAQTGLTQAC